MKLVAKREKNQRLRLRRKKLRLHRLRKNKSYFPRSIRKPDLSAVKTSSARAFRPRADFFYADWCASPRVWHFPIVSARIKGGLTVEVTIRYTAPSIPDNALEPDASALAPPPGTPRVPRTPKLSPLNPRALLRRALHPGVLHPRDTIGASRMLMDHGKPGADFQRVDAGIHDNPGTPYTAGDHRLTPV